MPQQLNRRKHFPPVRKPVVGNSTVVQVSHEAERQFAPGPEVVQVLFAAHRPLFYCIVVVLSVCWCCEKATIVWVAFLIALAAVTLNGINSHWATFSA